MIRLKIEKKTDDAENINKFIDFKLNVVRILILEAEKKINILELEYSHEHQ